MTDFVGPTTQELHLWVFTSKEFSSSGFRQNKKQTIRHTNRTNI